MKEWFFELLKKADLYHQFINTYGDGNEAACCTKNNHLGGWYFDEDAISYRIEDLFDTYEEALTFFKKVKEETVKGYERRIKIYEDYSKAQITQLGMGYKGEIEYYKKFIETHKADLV